MEANKGVAAGDDDRILDAEGLALKFFFHAASALYLYRSTSLPEFGANFFDPMPSLFLTRKAVLIMNANPCEKTSSNCIIL